MNNHYDRHDQGQDMREACRTFEDDGVGHLDGARIAVGLGVVGAGDGTDGADERTEGQWRSRADGVEGAETHRGGGYGGGGAGRGAQVTVCVVLESDGQVDLKQRTGFDTVGGGGVSECGRVYGYSR